MDKIDVLPAPKGKTLTSGQWDAIRTASLTGIKDSFLAERYGIQEKRISSKRSHDPAWKAAYAVVMRTAYKVEETEKQREQRIMETALAPRERTRANLVETREMEEILEENMQVLSEDNRRLALMVSKNMLKKGLKADFAPESFDDMKTAADIASKAGGWANAPVTVNVSAYAEMLPVPVSEAGKTIEMEPEEMDEREAYFTSGS